MSDENRSPLLDIAAPEQRASKRLAADLLRFERAFDRLERERMGLGAIPPGPATDETPASERDLHDYLQCLDQALCQLAEEFAGEASVAKALKKHGVPPASGAATLRGPNAAAFEGPIGSGPTTASIDTSSV